MQQVSKLCPQMICAIRLQQVASLPMKVTLGENNITDT